MFLVPHNSHPHSNADKHVDPLTYHLVNKVIADAAGH